MVGRIRRVSSADAQQLIAAVASGTQRGTFIGADGVFVVSDRVEVLRRIGEALEQLEAMGSSCWAVQLYVVSLTDDMERDLGLDVAPKVNLAAVMAGASGGLSAPAGGASAVTSLDVTLRAVAKNERGSLLADPLLLLVDGVEGKLTRGREVPVKTATVTQSTGTTVSQQGIQTIFSGMEWTATIKEVDDTLGRLKLRLTMGDLDGVNDGLPIVRNEVVETQVDVVAGGVYLLASLKRQQDLESKGTWLSMGRSRRRADSTLQVWARVMRVATDPPAKRGDDGGVPPGGDRLETAKRPAEATTEKATDGAASPVVPDALQSERLGPVMMP